jgi:hypothetical protein
MPVWLTHPMLCTVATSCRATTPSENVPLRRRRLAFAQSSGRYEESHVDGIDGDAGQEICIGLDSYEGWAVKELQCPGSGPWSVRVTPRRYLSVR